MITNTRTGEECRTVALRPHCPRAVPTLSLRAHRAARGSLAHWASLSPLPVAHRAVGCLWGVTNSDVTQCGRPVACFL